MSETWKKRVSDDEPHSLKPRADSIITVVGVEEFHECIHLLRCISDHFDAEIRSEMKEAREMKLEFRDKDPEEWKLVMALCKPFATIQVNRENWEVALPWFDEFCIPMGLKACDGVFVRIAKIRRFPLD